MLETESKKLFLKANDEESCDVISSLLQDSIFHITSHSFHDDKKCLRLMLNRFCWELLTAEDYENYENNNLEAINTSSKCYYRVHSGLYIHNVEKITINNSFKDVMHERYLNLLAIHAKKKEINILFSGHRHVCVKVKSLNIYLKDLHDRYPTPVRSIHNFDAA
ncbi:MAG: DUF2948 family protein [Alphaproteobacteria bacterium]|nr:DUF2948 family protein [Alphaproteobacteria bacterium]